MGEEIKWLFGLFMGGSSVAFWKIWAALRALEDKTDGNTAEVHRRINHVRAETVSKADLDDHINRLSRDMRDLRQEHRQATKDTNARLDAIITSLSKQL